MKFCLMILTVILGSTAMAKTAYVCADLEKSYKTLCTKKKKGSDVCLFKNSKDVLKALDLIDNSPQISQEDIQASEKFYATTSPTQKDLEEEMKRAQTNCWSRVHVDMWSSIGASFDGNSKPIRQKSVEVLKKRNALPDIGYDIFQVMFDAAAILEIAHSHIISASAPSLQELEAMRADHVAKIKGFVPKWSAVLPSMDENQAHKDPAKEVKYNVPGIVKVMKEEHAYQIEQRKKLQAWIATNLK